MSTLTAAGLFLINTLFDLYILVLTLRFLLTCVGANYLNPIIQAIIKFTQPIIHPLKKILPDVKQIETTSLILILLLETIKYLLIALITTTAFNLLGILMLVAIDTIKLILDIFFYAILIQFILIFVKSSYSPLIQVLFQLTQPILRPFHRLIPPLNGIDLSPLAALIFLQLLSILLVKPFLFFATGIAFG